MVVWTLLVFSGGVAAGPYLIEQASLLIERGFAMTGMEAPSFVAKRRAPARPVVEPLPGSSAAPTAPTAAPVQDPAAAQRAPQPVAQSVAPQIEKIADTQSPILVAAAREPSARHGSTRSAERPASSKAATAAAPAPAPRKKAGSDPFELDSEASTVVAAAPAGKKGKGASANDSPGPAPKAEAGRSNDPLDSLMAGGTSADKSKSKRDSKEIDDVLKDVQKSNPEPAPKKEPQASLPPLSASDISRVMAGVKSRGSECAQKTGQRGTAELKITVGKDGRVSDVRLGGKLVGTPAGECIDRVARAATFPPSAGLRFDYRVDVR